MMDTFFFYNLTRDHRFICVIHPSRKTAYIKYKSEMDHLLRRDDSGWIFLELF